MSSPSTTNQSGYYSVDLTLSYWCSAALHLTSGVCKKTTGSTSGRWVGQWWVGPQVWSAAFLCPDRSRPPVNTTACNFLTRNRLMPTSTQLNFDTIGLYRLNKGQSREIFMCWPCLVIWCVWGVVNERTSSE